jgi:hypothetical protein
MEETHEKCEELSHSAHASGMSECMEYEKWELINEGRVLNSAVVPRGLCDPSPLCLTFF